MKKVRSYIIVLVTISILSAGCKAKKTSFVTIGTVAVTGIFYPTGGAISQMVNKKFDEYCIKATVESTSGSVFNINAVLNGDLEFGIVQSDRQYKAYNGLAGLLQRINSMRFLFFSSHRLYYFIRLS